MSRRVNNNHDRFQIPVGIHLVLGPLCRNVVHALNMSSKIDVAKTQQLSMVLCNIQRIHEYASEEIF